MFCLEGYIFGIGSVLYCFQTGLISVSRTIPSLHIFFTFMTESEYRQLLKVVWGHRLYGSTAVRWSDGTVAHVDRAGYSRAYPYSGEGVEVLSGPDFEHAGVSCGESMLYGGVRVDIRSSSWRMSGDISSPAYDSVLFHVVVERDRVLFRHGHEVRTLILEISPALERQYSEMLQESHQGSSGCRIFFGSLAGVEQEQILSRLLADRLRRKSQEVEDIYHSLGCNWDETAYVCYMRSLGMGDRKRSYEALARSVPYGCIVRCQGDVQQGMALLLGQSGYLSEVGSPDPTIRQLQDIYLTLKEEYGLRRPVVNWGGASVRPSSLPPAQLSNAAAFLVRTPQLGDRVREGVLQGGETLRQLFVGASTDRVLTGGAISQERADLRIINFAIPYAAALGRSTGDTGLQEASLGLYDGVAAEHNRYTRQWGEVCSVERASESQAIVQLCTEYCGRGRCGECPIGVLRLVRCWRGLCSEE